MQTKYHGQFTAKRLILLGIAAAAVVAWQSYLQFGVGVIGDKGFGSEEWRPFIGAAIWCVVIVIVLDVITVMLTMRRTRRLPEEERDWEGPDPHADRKIPVEAWSPSPIMQAAIRRTIAKQDQ